MTIKRRLFISNILMIAIPMVLTFGITLFNIWGNNENIENVLTWWFWPIVSTLIVSIFIISRVLSRALFKDILTSLDVLSTGVEEISSGNLDYVIEQNMGNEFDAVGGNFNEMANRLSQMVNERQADEQNRKELIAGISHDLRTPLTSIKIYLEGLKKGVATTPEMQEKYLNIIEEKADNMAYIINQLFLFSQMDLGEFPLQLTTVDFGVELEKLITGLSDECQNKGLTVILKEHLYERIWGMDALGDVKTVGVHIGRIRDKIETDPQNPVHIETVWGQGIDLRYNFRLNLVLGSGIFSLVKIKIRLFN